MGRTRIAAAMTWVLALGGAPALAQTAGPPAVTLAPRAPPADTAEVARIRAALKGYLRDEKTARIAIVGAPRRGAVNAYGKTQTGRILCAQVDARDKNGRYAGPRPFMFVLQDDGAVGVWQHGMLRGSDRVIEAQCAVARRR